MLLTLHNNLFRPVANARWLLPTLARFAFIGVLLGYFWNAALLKLGEGLWGLFFPTTGAYSQIFPRALEAVGYDTMRLDIWHWAVVVSGTAAEFVLPFLIAVGLLTRLAALGMVAFVIIQSLTDIYGHGVDGATIGTWFDNLSDGVIVDQRTLWVVLLAICITKGAGPISLDRLLKIR
ncbi:MAG: DoxX family protein [Rhodobacteraceae bacterium]|nr:DoxX family protein [Paracoccaceae bacterium]